ncbi:MAG: DUF938 domain-containing protein [Cyanobacteria bacterium P01_H01_bin.153]
MSRFVDHRQYAPATERNREPIRSVLTQHLPAAGTILEIASGTGQHAAFLAAQFPSHYWLPSDPNPIARDSIRSWRQTAALPNLGEPLDLDVTQSQWVSTVATWQQKNSATAEIRAIVNVNMIHISPWSACEGLFAGAADILSTGDVLYMYGPFMRAGQHTAPSNQAFDRSLRSQNPDWGVRDLDAVRDLAQNQRFALAAVIAMPANNFSLIFTMA